MIFFIPRVIETLANKFFPAYEMGSLGFYLSVSVGEPHYKSVQGGGDYVRLAATANDFYLAGESEVDLGGDFAAWSSWLVLKTFRNTLSEKNAVGFTLGENGNLSSTIEIL